ncbi:MAG: DUF4136 domain-containing protein [Xanthomonadales bacterium]|nr:DUF4136 domain-containing protein [Gammaproteobacteria bacterium]NNK05269.1 DUF4136 domain-containing protein [Xanthomonadales bacterium]NNK98535.1 DUF4136 domain-containing protein [Xanthomonadales bacterium]
MSKFFKVAVTLVSVMLITACGSTTTIKSDYDRSVDFSQFKTYGYYSPMGIENPNYSSLLGQMFRDAIDAQMKPRGYVLSNNPDLLINVSARMQDKTQVRTYSEPAMYGGYYGYRGGLYDPWGGYGYGTSTHVSQYTEGTINVDMVDIDNKRMVWEGIAIGRVDEKKKNDNLRQDIMDGIAEMFVNYPFRAGE